MNTIRFLLLIVSLATLASHSHAQEQPATSNEQVQLIDKYMLRLKEKHGIPGITIAVGKQNKLWYSRGYGQSDVENSVPATSETKYRTASIAKSLTAVVVMSLVEDEIIDLDTNIRQYCQEYPAKEWPITTRQLLGHLAGIRHYKDSNEAKSTQHFFTLKSAMSTFRDDPLLHEPSIKYVYSSFGYNLLGSVAEGATGRNFVDLLQEKILDPAEMRDTVVDDSLAVIPRRTRGYFRTTERFLDSLPSDHNLKVGELYNASSLHDTSMKIPGGGLLSTAPDLVRFANAVNQGKLLKDETRQLMWTTQKTSDEKPTDYGLGWRIGKRFGREVVSHTGSQSGTSTVMMLVPETGTSVAIMSNLENVTLSDLAATIANLVDAP